MSMSEAMDTNTEQGESATGTPLSRALAALKLSNDVIAAAADESALVEAFCRLTVETGGYRMAWVGYLGADGDGAIQPVAHAGHEAGYLALYAVPAHWSPNDSNPVACALRSGHPATARGIDADQHHPRWGEAARARGYAACIALPLHWQEEMFGVFALYSRDADAFDREEVALLGALADKLSVGIHFMRLARRQQLTEQAMRNEKEAQEALSEILRVSLTGIPLEEKLDRVLAILFDVSWLQIERSGAVFLSEPKEGRLRLVAKRYLSPKLHQICETVPYGHCLCGKAAASGETQFRCHLDEDHSNRYDGIADHGHYCQPIIAGERTLGVLNLYVAAGHEQSEAETKFVTAVADTLAGVIERDEMDLARRRLATVVEGSPDFVGITEVDGAPLYFNRAARDLLGCEGQNDDLSCRLMAIYPEATARQLQEEGIPAALREGVWVSDTEVRLPSGTLLPVSHFILAPRNEAGEVQFIANVCRDISDRKEAEAAAQALALREKQFANTVINGLPGIFFVLDDQWQLGRWNGNLQVDLGYREGELRGMPLLELVLEQDREAIHGALQAIDSADGVAVEVQLQPRTGRPVPYLINILRLADSGSGAATIIGVGFDITDRKQLEQQLLYRASRDGLTGAYNRSKGIELFEHEVRKADRYGRDLSLLMFDIDHFKAINDTHGHDVGDAALKRVVNWTQECLRSTDIFARWGGEEFVVMAPETSRESAGVIADKIRARLSSEAIGPVERVTASFGVAQYRQGESIDALLKRADDALYRAKHNGRNRVCADDAA